MILTKNEAICLVLGFSENHKISSITKLDKLLARLNLHLIPVDIEFSLNKYGSYNADLKDVKENEFFKVEPYQYKGGQGQKLIMKSKGVELFEKAKNKLEKIFTNKDFDSIKEEIVELSKLAADSISNDEHKKLLVNVEDRFKLEHKINEINVDMFDLYSEKNKIGENTISEIRLRALIEYCYFLAKYLKEIRFKKIVESGEYDYDANMLDYYYIYLINKIIPFFKQQISTGKIDDKEINKYYQFIVNFAKSKYSFSLDNKDLKELIQKCH